MPKVSVIIPTYNRGNLIHGAIESVSAQTYQDFEIIVVDDGSSDQTRSKLAAFRKDNKIRYIFQENRGSSSARNRGGREAEGEYLAFLDSDDLFLPTKLEKQAAVLETEPDFAMVQSFFAKFRASPEEELGTRKTKFFSGHIYPQILTYWSYLMNPSCILIRKSVFEELGGFDESMPSAEDLDFFRRVARKYPIGLVPEVLAKIRVHEGNKTADKTQRDIHYLVYLKKAFAEDTSLSSGFKRRAYAKMYLNVAYNNLGDGSVEEMKVVRKKALKAISFWPYYFGGYLAFILSFLGHNSRRKLYGFWKMRRYR